MDDSGNSGGVSDGYRKLPRVSMSMLTPASRVNHYKLLAGILAVLAAILLVVDIGLGVYYNKLTDGNNIVTDIASEMTKLQATYDAAIKSRDEVKKQLQLEISKQQVTKWELEHQSRRSRDYQKQTDKLQMEIAALKSHIPMIEEGCRHCLPGWTFINSVCYYFPLSDTIPHKSWADARQFCKKQGGDLASIQSRGEHLAVAELVNNYQDRSKHVSLSGFWIGLRDVEEEGIWKWLDGTKLTEGYWNDGEPNDQGNEDCVAIYPRSNPFKAWNDAPCTYSLKWICEMEPRSLI